MSNLTEKAYLTIRNAIVNGVMKPGERLVEKRVCEEYKLARTPLREALRLLQMEGYVNTVPNKGVTISRISPVELDSIYNIVGVLEGYAVETATPNIKEATLNKLESFQDKIVLAGQEKRYRDWIKLNSQFHETLVKCSGNDELNKIIRNLRDKIRRYRYMSIMNPDRDRENYVQAHRKIVEYIRKGQAKKAGEEMRKHVIESKDTVIAFLEQFPEFLG